MKKNRYLNSEKGYSLPELLLAAGIILMISSIVLAGIKAFSEQKKKVNVTLMALSLQSALHASIKEMENYPEPVQDILKDGVDGYESLEYKSNWRSDDPVGAANRTLFKIGQNVSFNLKKESLPVDSPKGLLRLYTKIRKVSGGVNSSFPVYKIAYRIIFADPKIPHLGSPLAEHQRPHEFADTDYIETIPHELYMGKNRGEDVGQVNCDPNVDLGIHGFSRDTGAPICIEKIYGTAPPKSFARHISFVEGYYGDSDIGVKPHVEMIYVPFRSYTPPQNYIFQKIDTKSFDPQGDPSGITYVFIYKKYSPFYTGGMTTGTNSVTAHCPKSFYRAQNTTGFCSITSIQSIPGTCTVAVPDSDPPATTTVSCAPDCPAGNDITYSDGGSSVTCTYNPPSCPNGGSYSATLTFSSSSADCILSEPETKRGQ